MFSEDKHPLHPHQDFDTICCNTVVRLLLHILIGTLFRVNQLKINWFSVNLLILEMP